MASGSDSLSPAEIRRRLVQAAAETLEAQERDPILVDCPTCQGVAYLVRAEQHRQGFGFARPCPDCEPGQAIARAWAERRKGSAPVPEDRQYEGGDFEQAGAWEGDDPPF